MEENALDVDVQSRSGPTSPRRRWIRLVAALATSVGCAEDGHAQAPPIPATTTSFITANVGYSHIAGGELVERSGIAAGATLGVARQSERAFSAAGGIAIGFTGKIGNELTCQIPDATSRYRGQSCLPVAPSLKFAGVVVGAATRRAPGQLLLLAGPMFVSADCLCTQSETGIRGRRLGIDVEAIATVNLFKSLSLALALQNITLPNVEGTHLDVRQVRVGFHVR